MAKRLVCWVSTRQADPCRMSVAKRSHREEQGRHRLQNRSVCWVSARQADPCCMLNQLPEGVVGCQKGRCRMSVAKRSHREEQGRHRLQNRSVCWVSARQADPCWLVCWVSARQADPYVEPVARNQKGRCRMSVAKRSHREEQGRHRLQNRSVCWVSARQAVAKRSHREERDRLVCWVSARQALLYVEPVARNQKGRCRMSVAKRSHREEQGRHRLQNRSGRLVCWVSARQADPCCMLNQLPETKKGVVGCPWQNVPTEKSKGVIVFKTGRYAG